jgi:hypothetical protein
MRIAAERTGVGAIKHLGGVANHSLHHRRGLRHDRISLWRYGHGSRLGAYAKELVSVAR